jgi:hypothetical protein
MEFTMTVMTYGKAEDGITFDTETLPAASVQSLLVKGMNHYFGNECASKVTSWKEGLADPKREGGARVPSDVEIAVAKLDFQKSALAALLAGTVGHSARGPRATPIDSVMRLIAETEIRNTLKANNLVMPTGEKTVQLGANAFTRQQLIDRRLASHGDRIRKEAEAKLAADERKAKKAMADAGGDVAQALGL